MRLWQRKRKRDAMETTVADTPGRSEAEVSRERAHATREQVIKPLRQLRERNQFAELIRDSLTERRRGKT